MIWSDECYIYIGDDRGTVWVTRSVDEEFDENCVVPTFKQSALRVMIWACIMEGSKGPMVILDYPGGQGGGLQTDIKIKFWTKCYLTTMGRCLKHGDRQISGRMGHLVIVPKP